MIPTHQPYNDRRHADPPLSVVRHREHDEWLEQQQREADQREVERKATADAKEAK